MQPSLLASLLVWGRVVPGPYKTTFCQLLPAVGSSPPPVLRRLVAASASSAYWPSKKRPPPLANKISQDSPYNKFKYPRSASLLASGWPPRSHHELFDHSTGPAISTHATNGCVAHEARGCEPGILLRTALCEPFGVNCWPAHVLFLTQPCEPCAPTPPPGRL